MSKPIDEPTNIYDLLNNIYEVLQRPTLGNRQMGELNLKDAAALITGWHEAECARRERAARIDELEKIDDKASSMTFSKGYGGSVWYRLAELRQSEEGGER